MVSGRGVVSVVITTYNRPGFLQEAIESVVLQTYDSLELIVVDDHSTESPAHIVNAVDHDRFADVIFLRQSENRGVSAARNTGMEHASGEYIAFLDDDDLWVPDKIARQVRAFEHAADDVGLCYTGVESVTDDGDTISVRTPTHDGDPTKALLEGMGIPLPSIMIRRDVFDSTGGFRESMQLHEDREWIIRVSDHFPFTAVEHPLLRTRRGETDDTHAQLTDTIHTSSAHDFEQYLDRCQSIGRQYGRLFERKAVGDAYFRRGYALISHDDPASARRLFRRALMAYPFAPRFFIFFILSLFSPDRYDALQQYKRYIGNFRRG